MEVVAQLPAPGPELHLSACQPVLPQLPPEQPAFPVIKGSQRNVGFFIHPLLSRALFSLQRTYRMPKDIHVEPEKFAAELINRLEEVQKEREAEEKLEERLKRVRAVSVTFLPPLPAWLSAHPVAQGAFSCCGSSWGGQFPAPLPWSSVAQGSWRLLWSLQLPQCCSPIHAGLCEFQCCLALCKVSAMAQQCPLLPSLRGCGCSPSPSLVPWLS